ncbi:MAG: AAA family ATPase [Ureaplasma sp.]|nr:AAA family ATPase [Ureaplasma sp.]
MEMKQTNKLSTYARNLNEEIINNKVDPIIGREDEIRKVIEILNRKNKNNPVLIGEPGVGKTAIVEGLAQRIVNKDVPDSLKDKEIWELSLTSLISGASYQGEFEQRMQSIINEVKKSNGKIILFIDEIHQLVGMGKTQGSMDAANILKPMMARGEIKLIGATTLKEYRENIEKDPALERRMSKIIVDEPSKQEALTIMRGLKEKWEVFHGVKITDSALVTAVDLSERYITDRFLPDKAIDLIDEACARIQIEMHSMPEELDQIKRTIVHLQTEKFALSKETTEKAQSRLVEVEEELAKLEVQDKELTSQWQKEKAENEEIVKIKSEIDQARNNVERYQALGEYAQASALLYVKIPELEKQKKALEEKIKNEGNKLITDVVTEKEIGEVISKSTGIPLSKIVESEKDKLIHLKDELLKDVKGQDQAISLVASAVLRGRAGINDPNKPIGSFLFLGPTGVGKTEVSKALTNSLFDSNKNLIRFDMSEYMEKHSVSKLIGAPPGYVGYDQAGLLTEAVCRKPYSVVLFDEIEKAHSDVLNILLQILDEGQLKDSQGKMINFKNTIIILTSNIGAEEILENNHKKAEETLKVYLKPELLNRIDEIIWFNPLAEETIKEISKKLLDELSLRMLDNNYRIKFDSSVVDIASSRGYDRQYGARPLKRWIQKFIENKLAELIIKGDIHKHEEYTIKFDSVTDSIKI